MNTNTAAAKFLPTLDVTAQETIKNRGIAGTA